MPTERVDFLRIAFLDFIRNDLRPDFIDPKLMRRLRTGRSERFISKAAFARRYGINPRTAARFVEDQGVPSRTFRWGKSERKLIDSAAARLSPTVPGKIYRLRQAAAMIGISSELLRRLKTSGDFEVNHLLRTKPGFHELDIEAFIQKLKRLASPVTPRICHRPSTSVSQSLRADGMVPSRPRQISCAPCCRESCRSLATSTERSLGCSYRMRNFSV